MQENPLFKFLSELVSRLFSKNPKFFKYVQLISVVLGALSAVVVYLQSVGISLPGLFTAFGNINVIVSSVVATILSQLPNDTTTPTK